MNSAKLRVVLVEPRYDINIGCVARAMANFACSDLRLVRPKVNHLSAVARMFAKKGCSVLEKAKVTASLKRALEGATLVACTTGVPARFQERILKNCITLKELAGKVTPRDVVALVFGSEDRGLSEQDFQGCGVAVSIPANKRYPVLNLSHAVAILLYELHAAESSAAGARFYRPASAGDVKSLEKMFREILAGLPSVRDKRKVALAFKRILNRARPAENEVKALFAAVSPLAKQAKVKRVHVGV